MRNIWGSRCIGSIASEERSLLDNVYDEFAGAQSASKDLITKLFRELRDMRLKTSRTEWNTLVKMRANEGKPAYTCCCNALFLATLAHCCISYRTRERGRMRRRPCLSDRGVCRNNAQRLGAKHSLWLTGDPSVSWWECLAPAYRINNRHHSLTTLPLSAPPFRPLFYKISTSAGTSSCSLWSLLWDHHQSPSIWTLASWQRDEILSLRAVT